MDHARPFIRWLILLSIVTACLPSRSIRRSEVFKNNHTGFALYDLKKNKLVDGHNADKYFIPASNTKILTLLAGLTLLGDSVPALRVRANSDSLIVLGTGDPTLLNPNFGPSRVIDFLGQWKGELFVADGPSEITRFGPGWSWDDYPYSYSPERSSLPIYGNTVTFTKSSGSEDITVSPTYFRESLHWVLPDTSARPIGREEHQNSFFYRQQEPGTELEYEVPFRFTDSLFRSLLADTLKRRVDPACWPTGEKYDILYSHPSNSLYRIMMQESDNFVAEQILILCSSVLSDTLNPQTTIDHMQNKWLGVLPDKPVWVDGSGLSRYNLITPRSIIRLWEMIYRMVPQSRLFSLLAQGGKNGTLMDWYQHDPPFIFGKTGTLSNNHCLSGFLVTKRGKIYIFSFMNGNYVLSSNEIKQQMESILTWIHLKR